MKQATLANNDFEQFRKPTRREKFLAEMNRVVPWAELVAVIEPYYPKASSAGGRPPAGPERMLRIHCLQLWFDLSDPAVEEALYDSRAMRSFVGIDLGREPVPDETTVMRFRHLLEEHQLGAKIFEQVVAYCSGAVCACPRARSSMPPSSPRQARPRTPMASATRRCTRPRRASSGISA
jgi:transposase, IS5 family